ncbi:MAG: hypothetical protein K8I30_17110, partial [Anaerolineae bacterium]|nr:hypothetical protein [Anaerolineae bacterium]
MHRRKPMNPRQLAREKLLFRYSSALERGDFEVISAVLREAESDPVLERMLREMNDVYRAELAPPPALPSISANHNHRNTREDATMTVTFPTIRRVNVPGAPRGRWTSMATLAAAIIAIILFAAVLIARRPPNSPEYANPVIGLQNESATPIPSPTWTPTPVAQQATPSATPFPRPTTIPPVQDSGIVMPTQAMNVPILCQGIVTSSEAVDGVNVFSDSSMNGVYIGRIPVGAPIDILGIRETGTGGWYYVRSSAAEGWMGAEFVLLTSSCIDGNGQPVVAYPCGSTFATTATATPLPTMVGGSPDSPFNVTATSHPTQVPPCGNVPNPAITPTAGIPYGAWNSAIMRQEFGGIAANTPVRITAAYFDGTQWLYAVQTLDGVSQVYVPESSLIIYAAPDATPTAIFDLALRSGGYDLMTTEQVGDIPANALVRINSAQFDGSRWSYDVLAKDGQTRGLAYDYQLRYAPGVTPGAATPTAIFGSALGMGIYSAVTKQPIGDIPAGTRVRVGSAWYNGVEW